MDKKLLDAASTVGAVLSGSHSGLQSFHDPRTDSVVCCLKIEIRTYRYGRYGGGAHALRLLSEFLPAVGVLLDAVKGEPLNDEP